MSTPDGSPHVLAPGRIGAAAVILFALAATAPIAVVLTVLPAAFARGDGPLVPLTFVALAVVLLVFSAGYAAMARRAPFAGAMYTYVARGLGRPVGVGAAWVALLCYHALQLGLYGVAGAAAAPILRSWFHVSAQGWMVAAVCWALVAVCGTMRIEVTSGLIALLVLGEAAVTAGFAAANVLDPADGRITVGSVLPADPMAIDRPALGLLLVVGMLAFVGFETTGTYAEEAFRPRREVRSATYTTVVFIVVLLAGSAWAMSLGAGPGQVVELARARGPELVFDLAGDRLAPWAVTLGRVMLLTGLVAAMLALHHAIARYLFALGREQVLPNFLGRTARRTHAPRAASLTQSLIAGAVIAYFAGVRSPATFAQHLAVCGGLGILLLLLATSLAALLHLNRVPGNENAWTRFVAPVLSTVALGVLCFLAFRHLPTLLDVPPGDRLVWIAPAVLGAVAAAGMLHGLSLRGTRPIVYAGIGHAGTPIVITPRIPRQREPGAHRPERVQHDEVTH
ncbi:APC family permease [Micromonosporaceae bacterium Da 78-11]